MSRFKVITDWRGDYPMYAVKDMRTGVYETFEGAEVASGMYATAPYTGDYSIARAHADLRNEEAEHTASIQAHADAEHARQPLCNDCGRPGEPYEYQGVNWDGLIAYRGDRVCKACAKAREDVEGVDILVVDDRPGVGSYVYNTVRDRDKISVVLPHELRGHDGRDKLPTRYRPRNRKTGN